MEFFEEKLRKLEPVDKDTDLYWLLYLSGEGIERSETEELIDTIHNSIISLENDMNYVNTIESVIDLERFSSTQLDINIDTISAEISAIESQLEMEERVNSGESVTTIDNAESK